MSSSQSLQPGTSPEKRHFLELLALKMAIAAFSPLPVDQASWLMGKLWRHVLPFKRRNERTLSNLAYVMPHLTIEERKKIAADVRENFGRVFIEAFRLQEIADDEGRFDGSQAHDLKALISDGGGGVVASLHQGNWEASSTAAIQLGLRPAGVYRELTNPLVEALLLQHRTPFYPGGLFCKRPGSDVARRMLTIVKSGGTLAILADLRDDNGIHLDFLGKPSSASAFPAFVARMTGRPLLAGRLVRLGGVRFRTESEVVDVPMTDDRQADIAEATRRLAAVFERWIRENPEQWLWTHRKWDVPDQVR